LIIAMANPGLKTYTPGQYIFKEGDPSRSMYLVKRGTLSVRKAKGQTYIEVARIYQNEVLGELSFFDRLPRSASVMAITEVEVMEIKFDSLDKIYTRVPDYLKTIMAAVADRLRKANDMIRRLQKDVVQDEKIIKGYKDGPSAADALAIASQVGAEVEEAAEAVEEGAPAGADKSLEGLDVVAADGEGGSEDKKE